MSEIIAVIGDVHGNVHALRGMLDVVAERATQVVLAGDYVNRGPSSAEVIQLLVDRTSVEPNLYCISGNHDAAFLKCLDDGDLIRFLRIGGAKTIKSYVTKAEPDVLGHLRRCVPQDHVEFLRALHTSYDDRELLVTHRQEDIASVEIPRYHIFGHVPQSGNVPTVTSKWAAIDTGCGSHVDGRLTCLLWPSLDVIQVDAHGRLLASR